MPAAETIESLRKVQSAVHLVDECHLLLSHSCLGLKTPLMFVKSTPLHQGCSSPLYGSAHGWEYACPPHFQSWHGGLSETEFALSFTAKLSTVFQCGKVLRQQKNRGGSREIQDTSSQGAAALVVSRANQTLRQRISGFSSSEAEQRVQKQKRELSLNQTNSLDPSTKGQERGFTSGPWN